MKIIGHRGAAGLALENTIDSLNMAAKTGVDAVEFDIWLTKDGHLVLSHDMMTGRVGSPNVAIPKSRLKTIQAVTLHNGQRILTLQEAIKALDKTPMVIDAKGKDWSRPLAEILRTYPAAEVRVIALNHQELHDFSKLCPAIPVYAMDFYNPVKILRAARRWKFTGIDMSFWFLNPLIYWLARWWKLEVIVFSVDYKWLARVLRFLYPAISITTNRPDRLQALRTLDGF